MAENKVFIDKMPKVPIGKSDVIFQIETGGEKLGKLRVSKGTLYWLPTNDQYGYYLNWQNFSELMVKKVKRGKYSY